MAVVMGHVIGARLADLLDLPKNTVWMELRCAAGEPVTVRCGYYPDNVSADDLDQLISEFELHPKT